MLAHLTWTRNQYTVLVRSMLARYFTNYLHTFLALWPPTLRLVVEHILRRFTTELHLSYARRWCRLRVLAFLVGPDSKAPIQLCRVVD
jgi:hypothetical protein